MEIQSQPTDEQIDMDEQDSPVLQSEHDVKTAKDDDTTKVGMETRTTANGNDDTTEGSAKGNMATSGQDPCSTQTKVTILMVIIAVLATLVMLLALVVMFWQPNSTTTTTASQLNNRNSPTSPTSSPTYNNITKTPINMYDLQGMILGGNVSDPVDFMNINSPQYRAASWLVNEDEARLFMDDDDNNDRIIQRYTMAVLYFATEGDTSWERSYGFLSGQHECTWKGIGSSADAGDIDGIDCNDQGYVIGLALDNNGLVGSLPKEMGSLTEIVILVLNGNRLRGEVPQTFRNLVKLHSMYMEENDLGGDVDFLCDALPGIDIDVDQQSVQCTCCNCCQ